MNLLDSAVLWNLLWILPLFLIILYAAHRRRNAFLKRFLGRHASDPEYVSASRVKRFWRAVLLLLAIVCVLLAAARPSWGTRIMPYSGEGHDLLFVFDVSKSMLAQDVRPSRMEHGKWLVRELVRLNPEDRFGLIAFAGTAFLECPMTMDKTSFLQSVNELDTQTIPLGGTNVEEALKTALKAFKAAEGSYRAVILVTDGDELTGRSASVVSDVAKMHIPLFVAGIGDPSQPAIIQIPDGKGSVKTLRDAKGNIVNSQLNEKQLAELASKTGGIYVRSTTTSTGVSELEARIRSLDKNLRDSGKQTRPIERPVYPLGAAFLFFAAYLLLSEHKSVKKNLLTLLILSLSASLSLAAQEPQTTVQSRPASGGMQSAEEKQQEPGKSAGALYNEAFKQHTEKKDPAKASELYEQAITKAVPEDNVRGSAYQNLGVIHHQSMRDSMVKTQGELQKQQLQNALKEIDQALKYGTTAQDHYREAMRETVSQGIAANQQNLLKDKKKAEDLKKKIEDLLKKQQQTQQQTQKALNQQQKQNQNQQNNDKKQDQKQQQQNKQQQKQQNKQNQQDKNGQQQKQNQQETQKARQNAKEMKDQAKELNQKKMEQQAEKAEKELEKASQAQKKNDGKKAEEHLKKALEELGQGQKDQQNNDNKQDQNRKDQKNKDNKQDQKKKDQQNNDKKPGQQKQAAPNQPQQANEDKDFDKKQAEGLLDLMTKDEKSLKDEMKQRRLRSMKLRNVEKDW